MRSWVILNFLFLFSTHIFCQSYSIVSKKIWITQDTLELDTNWILPNSLRVKSPSNELLLYRWLQNEQKLIFIERPKDSIVVEYQRVLFQWHKEYAHKKISDIRKDFSRPMSPYQFSFSDKKTEQPESFLSDKLFKNGSISRGISFGNNQDMSVQSNFNMQMQGKLTKDIDIAMVATDNTIPFQADGTTAQLQELDKVYIQLSNKSNKLIVGDYQMAQPPNTYFMNFFKRLQGANFENKDSLSKNVNLKTNVAFALTRGKFARNVFYGKENNQGPYRLVGAEGEQIIVVLSGTENIYIDGKLMKRGQEYDYIIDYNTAEITFTAKQQITKDKRIVAEFQYVTKSYARSLYFIGEEMYIAKHHKVFFNFYSEQDNKNRPLQQQLTTEQVRFLSQIGDSLEKAFYYSALASEFNNSEVFYRKKDTIVGSTLYQNVFEYSTNPDSAQYKVTFSYVGANKGYYKQIPSGANGKVFQWVAPVNGVLQGDYMPYVKLDPPQQKQMLTTGYQYSTTSGTISTELVYSKNDVNTFSKFNKNNDEGYGLRFSSVNQLFSTNSYSVQLENDYEYVTQHFSYIQRYRNMEFQRDWNKNFFNDNIFTDQHITKSLVKWIGKKNTSLYYGFSMFSEGSNFWGGRHLFGQQLKRSWMQLTYDASYLTTKTYTAHTSFYRHKASASLPIGKQMVLSYTDDYERNIQWKPFVGTKFFTSYQFYDWEVSLHAPDSSAVYYKIFYRNRSDRHVLYNTMTDSTYAQNYGIKLQSNKWPNHPFVLLTTYRLLEIKNLATNTLAPDNTLLSRIEYYPRFWKNFLNLSVFYETGYGLENKKEYYYVEVTAPQGQYTWIDYNNDGIKQLNEFEIAQYPDQAKYIRVYVPTTNYVKVLHNQWSTALNMRPYFLLKDKTNFWAKTIRLLAFQTAFKNDYKTYSGFIWNNAIYSDFTNLRDTATISANQSIRQSIFFNQAGAIFGADYNYLQNASKQLLTNGYDVRYTENHEVKWRYNIFQWLTFSFVHVIGKKAFESQLFTNRNYQLKIFETEQKIIYQPNTNLRVSVNYKYSEKINALGLMQKGTIHSLGLEGKIIKSESASISGQFNFIQINYLNDNNYNTPVAYEILQSLQPGNNFTWNFTYQQNITSYLQMNILYEGRKSAMNNKIIHIGSMQLRAIF